ncbi:MAG: hypothetical protein JXA64_03785 [Candidatus Fermentibacteraceae bacterium]|nr:hypothetical protein [Candidatus Fermentibacteraceae bacterium]MBN2608214.1 hypothetical protein [Candidatus Fermentibacteraceae bacterium]
MIKLERDDLRWILVRLGVIVIIIVVCFLVISLGMKMFNKSLGLEQQDGGQQDEGAPAVPETFYAPGERLTLPEIEELPEGPEESWEITPCSLWVSGSGRPVVDSLPEAPSVMQKPLEALFLVRRWAVESGIGDEDISMVYVFTRLDTIYVDLPVERDVTGLKLTIENRFICFTRLFPLVAGNIMSAYPDGISLRGIEGVFRQ